MNLVIYCSQGLQHHGVQGLHYAGTGTVPVADTDEKRFKRTLCAPLVDNPGQTQWLGDDHTQALANHPQKSEIRGCREKE